MMKKYICESCNKDFNTPNKTNKFFAIVGLLIIYAILSILILPLSWLIWIIGLCHMIAVVVKDNGRGRCSYCGAVDFISTESVKGRDLVKKISKLSKESEEVEIKD